MHFVMRTITPCAAKVIDACAAPGNKTTQLAAMVGRTGEARASLAHARIHACTHPHAHGSPRHATPRHAPSPHAAPRRSSPRHASLGRVHSGMRL